MRPRPKTRWMESGLYVLGLVALVSWSKDFLDSRDFQSRESKSLAEALGEAGLNAEGTAEAATFTGPPNPGHANRDTPRAMLEPGVLGKLEIPRLGISAIVAEGADLKTLRHAVGHIGSTALPGQQGNCALAGHRDTFLRGLGRVRGDDLIRLVTIGGTHSYRVEWGMVVEPTQVEVLDSTATPSLTLITCYPFEFVGHAPKRFVVRARAVPGESLPGATAAHATRTGAPTQ